VYVASVEVWTVRIVIIAVIAAVITGREVIIIRMTDCLCGNRCCTCISQVPWWHWFQHLLHFEVALLIVDVVNIPCLLRKAKLYLVVAAGVDSIVVVIVVGEAIHSILIVVIVIVAC